MTAFPMLTIRRVPTLVSMNQASGGSVGELHSLGACCVAGVELPLYSLGKRRALRQVDYFMDDLFPALGTSCSTDTREAASLEILLLSQWEERMERGLFRYDVTACETKVLPGNYGFIAQLNEGRHLKKRPTEFRVDQVLQPYDPKKFNFTRIGQEEVLFALEEGNSGNSEYQEQAHLSGSPNVVAINVSPIEYGHVLLVPQIMSQTPQRICRGTFLLALRMAAEANNPYIRLGYNSLGAYATINHLHFQVRKFVTELPNLDFGLQAYYLAVPFPVERAPTTRVAHIRRNGGVKISELSKYPVRGLVYEIGDSLEELADTVAKACIALQEDNVPFNVLIADCGARVFLFPQRNYVQCFAERQARGEVEQCILDTQVNPAVWEISGHIVLKRKDDYEIATEDYAWKLLSEVSLLQDRFEEVRDMCVSLADKTETVEVSFDSREVLRPADDDAVKVAYRRNVKKLKLKKKKLETAISAFSDECIAPQA